MALLRYLGCALHGRAGCALPHNAPLHWDTISVALLIRLKAIVLWSNSSSQSHTRRRSGWPGVDNAASAKVLSVGMTIIFHRVLDFLMGVWQGIVGWP